jgi:hypothetical protein
LIYLRRTCNQKPFVTARGVEDQTQALVGGTLYPFMDHSTLDDQVVNSKITGTRLPLLNKIICCFQMALAISHTHFTAHTFPTDIKPANFVLDAKKEYSEVCNTYVNDPIYLEIRLTCAFDSLL